MTSNLEERLKSHNELGKGWTKRYRPWEIVYKEFFDLKKDALNRELYLKTGSGRTFIKSLLKS